MCECMCVCVCVFVRIMNKLETGLGNRMQKVPGGVVCVPVSV